MTLTLAWCVFCLSSVLHFDTYIIICRALYMLLAIHFSSVIQNGFVGPSSKIEDLKEIRLSIFFNTDHLVLLEVIQLQSINPFCIIIGFISSVSFLEFHSTLACNLFKINNICIIIIALVHHIPCCNSFKNIFYSKPQLALCFQCITHLNC